MRDVIIWNALFYGITINLVNHTSDYTFCILVAFSIVMMFAVFFLHKEKLLNSEVDVNSVANESKA